MGDLNATEELENKGHVLNNDGAGDSPTNETVEKPKTNGVQLTPEKSIKKEKSAPEQTAPKISPSKKDSTPPSTSEIVDAAPPPPTNPDKPRSTAEDETAPTLPSHANEVAAASPAPPQEGEISPLGSILKGSPFEQDENKDETSNIRENGATAEPAQPSEQKATGLSTPMTNGKPKEPMTQKAGLQSKSKTTPRVSAIGKKSAAHPAPSTTRNSENKPQTSTFSAPTTPKTAATPSKPPISKNMSPKAAASTEPKKETMKDANKSTTHRPSRPSMASKVPAAASKPTPNPGKKPGPTSPPSITRPRPKSPTRPVRLPGSATAPTAASAAKLDAAPAATAKPRDRVPSNPTFLRQKAARTSLPAGPKPAAEKAKDKPRSRLSTVSSKASEGSFLDRMMRPTQSSSQKTHEKVEAKTPPKKTNGVRPKRKSDGSEKAKSDNGETKGGPKETAPSPPVQAPTDSSEIPSTNGADKDIDEIDEAVPASATPIPSQ